MMAKVVRSAEKLNDDLDTAEGRLDTAESDIALQINKANFCIT